MNCQLAETLIKPLGPTQEFRRFETDLNSVILFRYVCFSITDLWTSYNLAGPKTFVGNSPKHGRHISMFYLLHINCNHLQGTIQNIVQNKSIHSVSIKLPRKEEPGSRWLVLCIIQHKNPSISKQLVDLVPLDTHTGPQLLQQNTCCQEAVAVTTSTFLKCKYSQYK